MFRNDMPRYEILSEDAMAVLERGWRRLLSDIGVEFLHDESLERFSSRDLVTGHEIVDFLLDLRIAVLDDRELQQLLDDARQPTA